MKIHEVKCSGLKSDMILLFFSCHPSLHVSYLNDNNNNDLCVYCRAEGGRRRGYMGHLTRIANSIVHNCEKGTNGPLIQQVISGKDLVASWLHTSLSVKATINLMQTAISIIWCLACSERNVLFGAAYSRRLAFCLVFEHLDSSCFSLTQSSRWTSIMTFNLHQLIEQVGN